MSRGTCSICHAAYAGGERFCPIDGGAIVESTADDPLIGKTIDGRYLVRRLIGRGGMGAVYEGHHIGLDKRIAIKFVIEVHADALARFRREARAASRIADEHVVQIFDVGTAEGREYLVMEYLDGRDLRTVLEAGPLPAPRALAIAAQILHGLHAIHEAGIVHRDIKPGNILLVGDDDAVKIMDFGISMMDVERADRVTQSGQVVGTPQFMAPEQLMGQPVDRRADLYAVGITLHAMLTGTIPFTGTSVAEVAAQQLHGPTPVLDAERDHVPAHVVQAVARALARSPEDRFATALEFADALGAIASPPREAMTAPDRPASKRDAPTSVERRRAAAPHGPSRGLTWLAAVGLVGLAAGVTTFLLVRGRDGAPVTASRDAAAVVEDPLTGARAAEHDGKLELAIARYLERYEAAHDPQLLFRIAELYERLDRTPDAVLYFRRYLEAAPSAPDRGAVEARIARLQPPPVDAGAPAIDAGARVAHTAPPPAIDPGCRCVNDDPRYALDTLCKKTFAPLCHCWNSEYGDLCPTPYTPCPAPCPDYAIDMSSGFWSCSVRGYANPYRRGTPGTPCKGYSTSELPHDPDDPYHPVERDGVDGCTFCRPGVDEWSSVNFQVAGKPGDKCTGHEPATGELASGHVKCGFR